MMTDPIADMLTRIRNALIARHDRTEVPLSKLKLRIAELLKREGYIADVRTEEGVPGKILISLKYGPDRQSPIVGLKRASRPGRRFYVAHDEIPTIHNGLGIAIMSTSHGVMTDKDARKEHVGGEVLCEVW